jgi:hypothetical protein
MSDTILSAERVSELKRNVWSLADAEDAHDLLAASHEALRLRAEAAEVDATDWLMVADGMKHDPRCPQYFAGDSQRPLCLRCRAEAAEQALAQSQADYTAFAARVNASLHDEALAARGWQDIGTAPKDDGKRVLLYWETRGASTGYWHIDEDDAEEYGWMGDQDLCIPRDQHSCTHWQPLPPPPGTSGGGQ